MSRKKPVQVEQPKALEPSRVLPTLINVKGTQEQIDWLEEMSRETRLAKSTIARLGFEAWAKANGKRPFPEGDTIR